MSVGLEIMSLIRTRRISATSPRRGQVCGAMPLALRVRNVRHAATRMTVSIGVAALVVMATVVPVSTASASNPPCTDTDVTCALIMGFTSLPTPDDAYIDAVKNQFIAPTHPGQHIEYVAVTTPEEGWPLTGLIRLGCAAVGAWSNGATATASSRLTASRRTRHRFGDELDEANRGIRVVAALVNLVGDLQRVNTTARFRSNRQVILAVL
jgi:hypothetical protein